MYGIQGHGTGGPIGWLDPHFADDALVTVVLAPFDTHTFPENQLGQVLFGLIAKGLIFLGCIDAGQSDFVLNLGVIQHGDGVTVRDRNNPSDQASCLDGWGREGWTCCDKAENSVEPAQPPTAFFTYFR